MAGRGARSLAGLALIAQAAQRLGLSVLPKHDAFVTLLPLAPGLSGATSTVRIPRSPAAAAGEARTGARSWSSGLGVGASALALLVLCPRALTSGKAAQPRRSAVALRARNPFPSVPTSEMNARRMRAHGKSFLDGRQISVRVNPKTHRPIRYLMHVKPGDTVQVVRGKDAGKVTTVLKTYAKWNKILCLGVNFCIKHVRPQRDDEFGSRVQVEAPIFAPNVMHYSEKEGVVGNLGIRFEKQEDGSYAKIRFNKATGEAIPKKDPPEWVPVLDRVD